MPDNDAPRNEEALDETIEESFPASDAPANTPETGISLPSADSAEVPSNPTPDQRDR